MQLIKIWATFLSSFLYHRNADAHTKHTHRLKDFGTMSHKSRIYIDAYLCTFKFIFFVYKHANGNEHLCEKKSLFCLSAKLFLFAHFFLQLPIGLLLLCPCRHQSISGPLSLWRFHTLYQNFQRVYQSKALSRNCFKYKNFYCLM